MQDPVLKGKVALVTGGSSGIGLATAHSFLAAGAKVVITGRSESGLASAIAKLGEGCLALRRDAGRMDDIATTASEIEAHYGGLDIAFLNAAVSNPGPIDRVDEAQFDELVDTNFKGVFFTIQSLLPLLRPGASIIVTTSITNQLGSPGFVVYGACKAALASMVRSLALDLINRQVRINAISPGPIETPMFDKMGLPPELLAQKTAAMAQKSPIKRFGRPDEIAQVALFLASDASSYIVGHEIVVDGGMSLL